MSHLIADEPLLSQLRGVVEPVEIRDPGGKVLGHYTPVLSEEDDELYRQAAALFDPEEMERIAATETQGYTFDQVMEHLRSLDKK